MAQLRLALDGGVSREIRSQLDLKVRRDLGAFFTSTELAKRLVRGVSFWKRPLGDPACGAGDLLLACARALPLQRSVPATLRAWGAQLYGCDIEERFVRLARVRLALLASARLGKRWSADVEALDELLPNLRVGDGRRMNLPSRGTLVMNPPFGTEVRRNVEWASGRISRAALFLTAALEDQPAGTSFHAILPDVLRSGTNYAKWRAHIGGLAGVHAVEPVGQFDPWTDIDVFLLRGRLERASAKPWPTSVVQEDARTVDDDFEVRVGTVVPHRDAKEGDESPYLMAHGLPVGDVHRPGDRTLRHPGRRFKPPFVAVRRTSRPSATAHRATATVVTGSVPVLVENHLLVCTPRDDTVRSCKALMRHLHSAASDQWLDERIRCRHLTVAALRELPTDFIRPRPSNPAA